MGGVGRRAQADAASDPDGSSGLRSHGAGTTGRLLDHQLRAVRARGARFAARAPRGARRQLPGRRDRMGRGAGRSGARCAARAGGCRRLSRQFHGGADRVPDRTQSGIRLASEVLAAAQRGGVERAQRIRRSVEGHAGAGRSLLRSHVACWQPPRGGRAIQAAPGRLAHRPPQRAPRANAHPLGRPGQADLARERRALPPRHRGEPGRDVSGPRAHSAGGGPGGDGRRAWDIPSGAVRYRETNGARVRREAPRDRIRQSARHRRRDSPSRPAG